MPYSKDTWTLGQQVDYGVTAALAGISHVAKYGREWLYNFYRVHRDWVNYDKGPYAFVVPATQRDPFATFEMLDILKFAEVEIHRATAPFTANGKQYAAGSWVDQDRAALRRVRQDDAREADLSGSAAVPRRSSGAALRRDRAHAVDADGRDRRSDREAVRGVARDAEDGRAGRGAGAGAGQGRLRHRPRILRRLPRRRGAAEGQRADVPRRRRAFEANGQTFAPGTFIIPPVPAAQKAVEMAATQLGLPVASLDRVPAVDGFRLEAGHARRPVSRRQQHAGRLDDVDARAIRHQSPGRRARSDFQDLSAKYDVILLAVGHHRRQRIVNGLDQKRNDPAEFGWAAGVGEEGWKKLRAFVENGGTLLAIGTRRRDRARAARPADREGAARSGAAVRSGRAPAPAASATPASVDRALRDAFSSPAQLMQVLRDRVAEPENLFYCPGSLLQNEFDPNHPVAWGMPSAWPVFFESDQAYRLRPGFGIDAAVAARYPRAEHPAERLAARRGVPAGSGQRRVVPRSARATSSPTAARSTSGRSRARRSSCSSTGCSTVRRRK